MFGSTQTNTGGGSSLFGGGNTQQNQTGGSSLFGGNTQQNQNQNQSQTGGSSLFGGGNTQQQSQPSGGLFGNRPQQSGGSLFGSNTQQPSQPQQSGGFGGSLFGGQQNQNQNQQQSQQQGQQQSGGLFGGGSSLFGAQQNQNQNQQQGQQQQPGGLFGGGRGGGGSSLFGGGQQNQNSQQQQQQQKPGGLFGGGSSLFGGSTGQPNQNNQNNNMNNQSTFGNSLLNTSQQQQTPQQQNGQPSLLNASRYNHAQYAPFAGSLRMGQGGNGGGGSTNNASNPSGTVAGVKISWNELRPTTRFADLIEPVQTELENIDRMIQQQESHCAQIQALMPKNQADIASLPPDVEIIRDKAEAVETVLGQDAQGVANNAAIVQKDRKDLQRCERVIRELQLPKGYQSGPGGERGHYGMASQAVEVGAEEYDTNLVGNYFMPLAKDLDKMLKTYADNLAEIEGHMRTIEGNAVHQAQGLAAKRAGIGGAAAGSGDDNVRELADTLRGFEKSILSAAAMVGGCRDGVNGLTMGSFGERHGRY